MGSNTIVYLIRHSRKIDYNMVNHENNKENYQIKNIEYLEFSDLK